MKPKIIVYTKQHCPYCDAAKRLLKEKGAHFEEIGAGGDDALREEIAKKSGQQTIPQIFVNDRSLGGYQDIKALDERGELDKILGIK